MFDGAASTKSLDSFKPKPVNSFYRFYYCQFKAPASFNTTVNSVCSSAATSPAPPETTTAAAAGSIPCSSFNIVAKSLTSFYC